MVPRAEMRLIRSSESMVGGNNQMMNLRIVDENGKTLSGFSSVASLILPKDAGLFTDDLIQIRNGISEPFEYVP